MYPLVFEFLIKQENEIRHEIFYSNVSQNSFFSPSSSIYFSRSQK